MPASGHLTVIAAASMFAWLGPLSRWAYAGGMEPFAFVAWRAGIGTLVLAAVLAVVAARGERAIVRPWRLGDRQFSWLLLATLMGLVLNMAIFAAFSRVTVALALLGFYTYPAMVAVVAIALGREQPSRATLFALVLALGGMSVVVLGAVDAAAGLVVDGIGVVLALVAAAAQTVFVTVSRDGYRGLPTLEAMTVVLLGSAVGSAAFAIVAGSGGPGALGRPLLDPALLPIVIAAGTLGAGIPSLMFLTGIRVIGGTRSGILMLFEPVVALGLAAVFLGELLRPVQLLGAAAVLGAAIVLQRSARQGTGSADDAAASLVPGGP
ncbi:MAG TPA: DMT family transporter [Candidatus Limnocylindrales bacterium]|nr:DMT family transporter [Candidatus Limnocylindrales bacterium]